MSFQKNVHKYSKWVLGAIVAIMALTLVISGNVGMGGADPDEIHSTIFTTIPVTKREWFEALSKAGAWYRLKAVRDIDHGVDYNSSQIQPLLFRYDNGPGLLARHELFRPSEDDLKAAARELIILGYDAKSKNVRATEEEVDEIIRGFLDRAGVAADDGEAQANFCELYFRAKPEPFKAAVRDSILIERALSLEVGGCNTSYEDLFKEKLSSSRSVRVLAAGIDGNALPGDLVPVTDEQIRARFERDKESYKMPDKVQVEYLMANFDDFKAKLKEPTPEEIQKYYDDKKGEFVKPPKLEEGHKEGDGHDHGTQEKQYKPLPEVREEIIKKIKNDEAFRQGWELLREINSKVIAVRLHEFLKEEEAREPKDAKAVQERVRARTSGLLAEIRDQYKAKGFTLQNGITIPFGKGERGPFTDDLGKFTGVGADPSSDWAFQGLQGEIAHQIYRSDKGVSLIRIANKIESYATDMTGPVREKIRQDLVREGAGDRARRLADELAIRIRANGTAETARLRTRKDLKIQSSTYLTESTPDAESGLTPSSLAQQVKSKFLKPPETPVNPTAPAEAAEVQAIHGDVMGGDRKDWAYVVVVEDSVQKAPDVKDEEFFGDVRRREAEAVAKARVDKGRQLVKSAEWKDAAPKPVE